MEVHEGHRIFINNVAVRDYQDFDLHHIDTRQSTPDLRYNLATERASIRQRYKTANVCPPAKRKASLSLPPPPARPFPSPESTTNYPAPLFSGSGTINDPIDIGDDEERQWPEDFFVDEVVPGLQEYKKTMKGQHEAVFKRRYPGITYCCTTVLEQVKKWEEAPAQFKDACLSGERIRWSVFARRLKKGKMIASASVIDLTYSE